MSGQAFASAANPSSQKPSEINVDSGKIQSMSGKPEVDPNLLTKLDRLSIEDVVELKISRFLDQIGTFYPENLHELIMSKTEKPLVAQILKRVGGNQVHAAKILGINRNTLRKKIRMYGL